MFKPGEIVLIKWGPEQLRPVPRRIETQAEADAINAGELPFGSYEGATLSRPKGKTHYFPNCRGLPYSTPLAWDLRSTTCKHCLYKRAMDLRGWRWHKEINDEHVSYLIGELGDRVKDFGDTEKYGEESEWLVRRRKHD